MDSLYWILHSLWHHHARYKTKEIEFDMKHISIIILILLCISSCTSTQSQEEKPYSIYWQDNNICVSMPHPTIGLVGLGREGWNGVDISEVIDDIYKECSTTEKSGSAVVWVRFENPQTDKYGNETMAYDDFEIAIIPLSEARKYKSGKFLDAEYKLTEGIRKVAFGSTDNADDYDEWLKSQYNVATDTVRAVRSIDSGDDDYNEWLKSQYD